MLYGEVISKTWSGWNTERKPKDVIYTLRDPKKEQQLYITSTKKMVELARDYHDELMRDEIPGNEPERQEDMEEILKLITEDKKLSEEEKERLDVPLTYEDIEEVLKNSENGKATEIDGLPYKLWKALDKTHKINSKNTPNKPSFDIIKTLRRVFNDIEEHGVSEGTEFTLGWMCPLYKKKDKREITNYRPISLMNSDYKILTKAQAMKTSKIIHMIIHKTQAGFMPKRSIADQVKLTVAMLNYCEALEDNSIIIFLDQEKVYDKIRHNYLWETLRRYNLPERMINTAKTLYENTYTKVMINGVLSTPFKVTRGVRQGDPWSCMLFDIAIEPLSNALRNLRNLGGFKIPGQTEKIIATLFADDTTIFLNEYDDYKELEKILKTWCKASGGRFNIEKTEILPAGTKEYRASVIENRTNHVVNEKLPEGVKIAIDGEPCRSLRGWVGNLKDDVVVWAKTLEKIKNQLNKWNRSHPTLKGKKHIIQMFIGGISQYLTTVQGMPKDIKTELTKIIQKFLWDNKSAKVSLEQMYLPIEEGGLGIVYIEARNEAIELIWTKKFLTFGKERPMWTYIADDLIRRNLPKMGKKYNNRLTKNQNPFLQTWAPAMHSNLKLPKDIHKFLKIAKKYNVNMEAIRVSEKAKKDLPAWYHAAAEPHSPGLFKKNTTECLIDTHTL